MTPILPPGAIGMLGGGQLGRYALVAARSMGYRTVVLDPDPTAPAGRVADEHLVAAFDDAVAVDRLASTCAVVTTEFENPPAEVLEALAARVVVAPSARAVGIAQDRRAEKRFLVGVGARVAPFAALEPGRWLASGGNVPLPGIVKTARLGYDGKGQRAVADRDQLEAVRIELGEVPCVLEQRLSLDAELSVIVARAATGETAVFDVAENHHANGILDVTIVPARVDDRLSSEAVRMSLRIAERLDYNGVLAVELFVSDGEMFVNEIAPRPHNSGHWTIDAARTSQFEQQIRAVCGSALGDPARTWAAVAMVNLLGDLWTDGEPDWTAVLSESDARLHLYGKAQPRPGRKMGHVTLVGESVDDVVARALDLRRRVSRR